MKKFLLLCSLLILLSGCAEFSALSLSDGDVSQAITLIEARDVKHCSHVDGSAGYLTFASGKTESYTAMGKNLEIEDCFKFFNPGVSLPGSK